MKLNIKYMVSFLFLFLIETLIAIYIHDAIIRPYIGDILVVVLMYTFIRGLTKKTIKFLPIYLFVFSAAVEFAQYFHIVKIFHLQHNKILSIIIGSSFDIKDILCYLVGTIILIIWDKAYERK